VDIWMDDYICDTGRPIDLGLSYICGLDGYDQNSNRLWKANMIVTYPGFNASSW
jgi:hypothetical protein